MDALPPSPFDMNNFKDYFVNEKDKKGAGMKWFLEKYDPEGYSIYFVHYEKYTGEGEILY